MARRLTDPEYAAEMDRREERAIVRRTATRAANDRARAVAEVKATRSAACSRCFATHAGEC